MEVDALLLGGSGSANVKEWEWEGKVNVKAVPEELLLDMPKATIGYARRTMPNDSEMGIKHDSFKDDIGIVKKITKET